MKVDKVLSVKGQDVQRITPDQSIFEAVALLEEHGIGALVVSSDGTTAEGMLSERDIVRAIPHSGDQLLTMPVHELMSSPVTTCTPDDTIAHVMGVMTEKRARHLPVVDNGKLVGLISIGDVVKHRVEELRDETETLRDYIGAR
ncbi:MAG: CBS domain-containing protein [Acidimicrobiia bacterium]|nr:CBS domain-containing protein [Acidimicrobiia bacterium]